MENRQKLSAFAASQGLSYQAAWKLWQQGKIEGIKLESGTILVTGWVRQEGDTPKAVIYARVSNPEYTELLEQKVSNAKSFAEQQTYDIVGCFYEVVPGMIFNRPQLQNLLAQPDWDILIVNDAHELSQLNFDTLQQALKLGGRRIIVLNPTETQNEPLVVLSQKFLGWAKQIMGMGHQKKALMDLLKDINK